jgi:predicted RNA-binding Zn ribbon-like protein
MSDPEFILLGDAVWIDFINTARGRQPDDPDGLPDPAAYHRWTKAEKLASDATELPWSEILDFRVRLLTIASALAEDRQPPSSAIHEVNRLLARTEGHHQLTRVGGVWHTAFTPHQTPSALEAIARSAALTLADTAARVHQCRAAPCTLFFVDRSPGHSRSWCSAEAEAHPAGQLERRRAAR